MKWLKKILSGGRRRLKIPREDELYERARLTPLFRDVPEDKIRKMIQHSTPIMVKDADVIVREGETGTSYYLIIEGMASVIRRKPNEEKPRVAAVLAPGFAFGEEALISNTGRNATIIMETDGILLRIPKQAFIDHIMSSLVKSKSPIEAQRAIQDGARWLDVRDSLTYQRSHLPRAISLPLPDLRQGIPELDPGIEYVCYSENGRESAIAVFLMRLAGYKAINLQGGLKRLDQRFRNR